MIFIFTDLLQFKFTSKSISIRIPQGFGVFANLALFLRFIVKFCFCFCHVNLSISNRSIRKRLVVLSQAEIILFHWTFRKMLQQYDARGQRQRLFFVFQDGHGGWWCNAVPLPCLCLLAILKGWFSNYFPNEQIVVVNCPELYFRSYGTERTRLLLTSKLIWVQQWRLWTVNKVIPSSKVVVWFRLGLRNVKNFVFLYISLGVRVSCYEKKRCTGVGVVWENLTNA